MITSTSNPLAKRARSLRQRKQRRREGVFFVEGPRVFLAAVDAGAAIETVIHAPKLLTSEPAHAAVERLRRAGVRCEEVSAAVFEWISDRDHPTGIGAIVVDVSVTPHELPAPDDALFVALVGVSDPGNLGAVLRTLDAVRGAGLLLVGDTTDPTHPTAVKASMGALFTVPVARVADVAALLEWARARGLTAIGTSSHARMSAWDADLRAPVLLVMGSEREGLDRDALAMLGGSVALPMWGDATSLNLAVATGVLLYEARRSART